MTLQRVTTDTTLTRDLEDSLAHQIEAVLITGDLAKLTPEQRLSYYKNVCESLGLNPLTKPFAYIILSGKLTLYALKDCTEQLRSLHDVSVTALNSQRLDDVFVVTANVSRRGGRTDAATGAVAIAGLKGESLANALMKAETKAKRRATLSICGLGMLDETEVEELAAREPQVIVEAPKAIVAPMPEAPIIPAPPMPEGTARILKVVARKAKNVEWADLTYVTAAGEELQASMPADPRGTSLALAEALCQESAIVDMVVVINKKGNRVVDELKRHHEPAMTPSELPPPPAPGPLAF